MGNKSKLLVATAGSAAFAVRALSRARRRARFAQSTKGISEVIMPSVGDDASSEPPLAVADESHAPGHRHLSRRKITSVEPKIANARPFAKHQRGLRHPGRR